MLQYSFKIMRRGLAKYSTARQIPDSNFVVVRAIRISKRYDINSRP